MFKNKLIIFKSLMQNVVNHFKFHKKDEGDEFILEKPKKSTEYSNIVRRVLLLIFTGQWVWLMCVSERMYIKNGDIGDNWTKLMISVIGLVSLVCGFYFSGQYSDRNTEEFKKIKEYDNERLDEYNEEKREEEQAAPKAVLEEDEEDD